MPPASTNGVSGHRGADRISRLTAARHRSQDSSSMVPTQHKTAHRPMVPVGNVLHRPRSVNTVPFRCPVSMHATPTVRACPSGDCVEATSGFEPLNRGFAVRSAPHGRCNSRLWRPLASVQIRPSPPHSAAVTAAVGLRRSALRCSSNSAALLRRIALADTGQPTASHRFGPLANSTPVSCRTRRTGPRQGGPR